MPDPITEEIEHGRNLLNEGKIEEALSLIEELEKKRELTGEEKLRSQIIKGNCLNSFGKFNEQEIYYYAINGEMCFTLKEFAK